MKICKVIETLNRKIYDGITEIHNILQIQEIINVKTEKLINLCAMYPGEIIYIPTEAEAIKIIDRRILIDEIKRYKANHCSPEYAAAALHINVIELKRLARKNGIKY